MNATEERLTEIHKQLDSWNSWVREAQVPGELSMAILTGRLELLKLAKPKPLTEEECKVLYELLGVLIETNLTLQQHSLLVAELSSQIGNHVGAAVGQASKLKEYANFRNPVEEEGE